MTVEVGQIWKEYGSVDNYKVLKIAKYNISKRTFVKVRNLKYLIEMQVLLNIFLKEFYFDEAKSNLETIKDIIE